MWLYATLDAVGSARAIARLTQDHDAYRWICGGVQVNHHTLSDFRIDQGEALDGLLTDSLAALLSVGAVTLKRVAQDGMRVRASAGAASLHPRRAKQGQSLALAFRRKPSLEKCLEEARCQVATLKQQVDDDPGALTRRQQAARERVAMDGGAVELTPELLTPFRTAAEAMAEKGLRVLAFAWRELPKGYEMANVETEMILAGLVGLEDPPRPEVADALQRCRDAGIKVIMVTGDHPHTASAIAREIGLVRSATPVVITGEQLGRLSDIQLQLALDAPEIVFARVVAEQKMRIVGALQNKREIVAVTGDGVNDAPALRKADVGIAMGRSGTDVAREAADMVLLDDNFASIVAAIEEGRAVFTNIRSFLTYILSSNVPELFPYLAFVVFRIPLPLTIIQILAVDLGSDMLPALGLGAEKPAPDIMKVPPRSRADRLLNWPLLARAPRPSLFASHDRLSQRHRPDANRQRVPLPQFASLRLQLRPLQQQADPRRYRHGDRAHRADRLHAVGQRPLRHRAAPARRLAVHGALRARNARAGRAAQMAHARPKQSPDNSSYQRKTMCVAVLHGTRP